MAAALASKISVEDRSTNETSSPAQTNAAQAATYTFAMDSWGLGVGLEAAPIQRSWVGDFNFELVLPQIATDITMRSR